MGRKALFDVKSLKIGQKLPFPKRKVKYIYQYLNNFNRSAESQGLPNRYGMHLDLEDTYYIKRIS